MTEEKAPHIFRPMTTMRGTPIEDGPPAQQDKLFIWEHGCPDPDDDSVEEVMLQRKAFAGGIGVYYYKQGYGYVGPIVDEKLLRLKAIGWGNITHCFEDCDEYEELRKGHGIE